MIPLSPQQQAFIDAQYGVDPTIVLAINFTDYFTLNNVSGGSTLTDTDISNLVNEAQGSSNIKFYSDKIIYDPNDPSAILFPGKILTISPINAFMGYDGNSQSSDVSVKIDDSDQSILALLGSVNIQKIPAFLYMYFDGMSIADMIPVYEGEIVSGFSWSDKDKSATFTIMNRIEQKEVGYSPEMGYISDIQLDLIGKPWPLGYGTVVKYPALKLYNSPTCTLTAPMGFPDQTLPNEIARLFALKDLYYGIALLDYLGALQAFFSGLNDLGNELQNEGDQAVAILNEVLTNRESLQQILSEMAAIGNSMTVISNIPIPLIGMWEIGGNIGYGTYKPTKNSGNLAGGSGTGFLTIEGLLPEIGNSLVPYSTPAARQQFIFIQAGTIATFIGKYGGTTTDFGTDFVAATEAFDEEIISATIDVSKESAYPMLYVVNCLGGTVLGVYATRPSEGADWIMPVPHMYWEAIKINTNPGGVVTTALNFQALGIITKVPLSSIPGVRWSDDIYVSFKSTVGPAVQDVLQWLVNNYTQYACDPVSLGNLPNFNVNFCQSKQLDVMTQIKEICFQCNIAVWLSEGFFYFVYLPTFTPPTMSASLNDIIADTVEIGITPTENIVTKIKAAWFTTYQFNTRNYLQLRYNDFRYGLKELDVEYYCFQDANSILQSMMFWLYRKGNTWKRLKFSLPLSFLPLQIFDNLHLGMDIVNLYVLGNGIDTLNQTSDYGIDASVISITLNPDTYLLDIELELPIYVGSTVNSPAYWLSQYSGAFYQIDENFDLTPKPSQLISYQRGESLSVSIGNAALQYTIANQFNNIPVGPTLWITQPDPVSGTPLPSNFDIFTQTDNGGPVNQGFSGSSPNVPSPNGLDFTQVQPKPSWDYNYVTYPPITTTTPVTPGCVPGTVNSPAVGDNMWNCTVYPSGLAGGLGTTGSGVDIIAQMLQDAPKDIVIPPGTWALFSVILGSSLTTPSSTDIGIETGSDTFTNPNATSPNDNGNFYYFQLALWLG
jgi:hypothetical protein